MPSLPPDLIDAFREGRATVFLGAGVSMSAGLPGWSSLVEDLADRLNLASPDGGYSSTELLAVPQYYENTFGRQALVQTLERMLEPTPESEAHSLIADLPTDSYFTTNFDRLLEQALQQRRRAFRVTADDRDERDHSGRAGVFVRKIHGTIDRPGTLIVTRTDYARYRAQRDMTIQRIRASLVDRTFLFLGYSLSDPDFIAIHDDVLLQMGEMQRLHYVLTPRLTALQCDDLRRRGFVSLPLEDWSDGRGPSDGLLNFLRTLSEHTSEVAHARRFFRASPQQHEVPIILPARLHEVEKFVYYPESDLTAAMAMSQTLGQIGVTAPRVADTRALARYEDVTSRTFGMVCSPFGNAFARRVYDEAAGAGWSATVGWWEHKSERGLAVGDLHLRADDPADPDATGPRHEYALIARYPNPWAPGHWVFVAAGVYALGTQAAGELLGRLAEYARFDLDSETLEYIVRVAYAEHDPFACSFSIEDVITAQQLIEAEQSMGPERSTGRFPRASSSAPSASELL